MVDTNEQPPWSLNPYRLVFEMAWVPSIVYGVSVFVCTLLALLFTLDYRYSSPDYRANTSMFDTAKMLRTPEPANVSGSGFIHSYNKLKRAFERIAFSLTDLQQDSKKDGWFETWVPILFGVQELLYFSIFFFIVTAVYGFAIFGSKESHCPGAKYSYVSIYPATICGIAVMVIMPIISHFVQEKSFDSGMGQFVKSGGIRSLLFRIFYKYSTFITAILVMICGTWLLISMSSQINKYNSTSTSDDDDNDMYAKGGLVTPVLLTMMYIIVARWLYIVYIRPQSTTWTIVHVIIFGMLFVVFGALVYGDTYIKHINHLFSQCPW